MILRLDNFLVIDSELPLSFHFPIFFLLSKDLDDIHQRSIMWKFAIILAFAIAMSIPVHAEETGDETENGDAMAECSICRKEECPPASDCRAGLVLDRCGCCNVCGRIEGEKCDNYTLPLEYKDRYGFCGDNMACLLRNDMEDLVRISTTFWHAFFLVGIPSRVP